MNQEEKQIDDPSEYSPREFVEASKQDETIVSNTHFDEIHNDQLSDTETLSMCVEKRMRAYFHDLNGQAPSANLYQTVVSQVEEPLLKIVMNFTNGNRVKASELLGISRSTLIKKLKNYGL